ncbi:SDR family oxidoreductase [Chachezhania antarctica]|uniref:SDR family oxidoreductase n=1 Tax=Chachezhania antarctica TaxID=2340860 RepID=UPI000EB37376|nr:SDR family oxidoreductase [Chachezhania antarctica]|tara:strand:- start:3133 stop:3960 length:828 start_codon:yes stop_codon:yes gene_type:complete
MSVTLDFADMSVVVVGGTSGINRGIAEAFASHGAKVAVASRNPEKVADTVKSLEGMGAGMAMGQAFDVRDPDGVAEGLAAFHAKMGDFDVLVSGAAGNFPALMSEMSNNAFRTVVEIDLMGTVHVMKAAYPFLKKPGASVVSISAPQAFLPYEGQSHVCAAKAGVDQITRTLAMEWGHEGIRINSVVPGLIDDTEGARRLVPTEEARRQALAAIPLERMGEKADVANMCLFLASPLASYVTGTVINVDGALYQGGSGHLSMQMGKMLRMTAGSKR